jgi:putative transposase
VEYSTDLSDQQWALIEPLLPAALPGGRPRAVDMRRVVDAILYIVKNGCMWRNLPHDFPKWQTVYWYFKIMREDGTITRISRMLVAKVREKKRRTPHPTIAIIDSQSVKSGKMVSEDKGYDGGKHVKGRKRHIAVDILGLPLDMYVSPANMHDKRGAAVVVERMARWLPNGVKRIYADGGYSGKPFQKLVKDVIGARVDIKEGGIGQKVKGFKPVAKRWIVERTFAWMGDYRRLDKDQERKSWNSLAMMKWAAIRFMLRKLFRGPPAWA